MKMSSYQAQKSMMVKGIVNNESVKNIFNLHYSSSFKKQVVNIK